MKNNYIDDFIDFIKDDKGAKSWEDVVSYCWYNMTVFININIEDYAPYESNREKYLNRLDEIVKRYNFSKYSDLPTFKYSISSFVRDLVNLFAEISDEFGNYYEYKYEYADKLKEVL